MDSPGPSRRPRSMAAPLSASAICASPGSSITAAASSRSGPVAASRRRKTAAAADGSPCCGCNEATAAAASPRPSTRGGLAPSPVRHDHWITGAGVALVRQDD
jgi:hypothetical protein